MNTSSVAAYLAASAREQVWHVDEHDQVLGIVPRSQIQEQRLITRCTYIFVYNSAGLLCMHQRTAHKRLYPGFWDLAAGGVVAAGESYQEGAERELEEELGIAGVPLTPHGRFFFQSSESKLWGGVYSCCWDGPIRMQPEEVMDLRWIDTTSSWRREHELYTPDSLQALLLVTV
ncbi:NUDIX hydrolase YfcD [Halopseudomonas laoshanensis]|uniref:NUDIX hydrolase YfcD n=1 Tax=Halopseudomonas laoshanensis TaxID=2268758 RepID=A0A7V7GW32_9GAMM|nr:NUDIX hydrolase YfcD [Halopseudomonas laoshanensis]KAA0694821.1 NUDIX hydrolase YfcD [Halopseudomonas laoshanensis]